MIFREEIDEKADLFKIHSSNVQRDYIFGWLLAGIYTISELKHHFVLKGGNCFRKAYFSNTRYSSDLDFSIKTQLSDDLIKDELNKVCDFISDQAGIRFEKDKSIVRQSMSIDRQRTVHEARIYFKDFYGKANQILIKVKLDITQFDKIYLPIQNRNIIHPYSDFKECSTKIKCVKIEELLASKLKCLLQRRQSSDLYDYVQTLLFQLQDLDIKRSELVQTFLKMTIFERNPGVVRGILTELPFHIFKAYWNKNIICPKESIINADHAVSAFRKNINELFSNFKSWGHDESFYPSNYRNIIMEAGENLTVLSLTYDGVTREVEPYSLSFKTKKDGASREYFYAYDRTGGRSSNPGIKTFLHDRIQQISNTKQVFEPRFEIELAKSIESGSSGYFSQPFASANKNRNPSRMKLLPIQRNTFGPKYIYECSLCGKKFKRTKRNARLNIHKDKYGNQCFGRTGILTDIEY